MAVSSSRGGATSAASVGVDPDQLDAVMAGSRALGALIAESLASVEDVVTMPQLRVLILAGRAPQSVSAVADDLGVHASNATRTCDRLVRAGLLDRRPADEDRRRVVLTLTPRGEELIERVMDHRRRRVADIMSEMSPADRAALASAMTAFADAAGTELAGPHPVPARHA